MAKCSELAKIEGGALEAPFCAEQSFLDPVTIRVKYFVVALVISLKYKMRKALYLL